MLFAQYGILSFQVTLHRVVNIVDERSPMPRLQVGYDRRFDDDQWYGGPQNYRDARECYGDEGFPPNDRRRYFDDNPHCNFRRNISQNVRKACLCHIFFV